MRENRYQAKLIKELELQFPGCFIMKNDSGYIQGVPDLTIFFGDRWAVLEVKADEDFTFEPNQEYYLDLLGAMSFSAVIHPGNEEDVIHDLQRAFSTRR